MIIDLNKLLYEDSININEKISYNEDYLKNTDILKLDDVLVDGKFEEDKKDLNVKGTMFLTDAITTLSVPYDFAIEIEEILENSAKTLDLIEFLWHYIVLEIPIRYTTSDVKELKNTYNQVYDEGWKENNNPFKDFFGE